MRLCEFLFGTTLMTLALVTTTAGAPTVTYDYCSRDYPYENSASEPRTSAPSPLISQDKVLGSAYYDTVSILNSKNPCSDFFGGPASVDILKELVTKIRKDSLPADIGMRMSGPVTNFHDTRTRKYHRVFAKVSLNSRGSFYRATAARWEPTVPRIGTFKPDTKEARVVILLHELGHLIQGSDGQWLLPDDGKDDGLSQANSRKIEEVCSDQILSLDKVSTTSDLRRYKRSANNHPNQNE